MIIYKIDSKEKLRFIEVTTEGDELIQVSGVVGGNPVENRKVCKGKNIGRSNETTGEEQAISDMKSLIKRKLKKDYYETVEEAKNTIRILPTLAKKFNEHYGKIDNDKLSYQTVYVQPKLDGQRSLSHIDNSIVKLISRSGTIIDTMKHIEKGLSGLGLNVILDGELYVHKDGENFQEIMSAIKKYRPGISEEVDLCVYDIVGEGSFKDRFINLFGEEDLQTGFLTEIKGFPSNIKKVFTKKVNSFEEILEMHDFFIENGFEGTIVRWGEQSYEVGKRSEHLLKYKDFKDRTAEVLDIIPYEARPNQGKLVCRFNEIDTDTDEVGNMTDTFTATLKIDVKGKEELLKNKEKYIGLTAEIVFQKYTDIGLPTGGMYCKGFRNDK